MDFSQRTMHPILTGTIAYLLMGAVANVLCMFWPAAMKDRGCAKLLPDRPPSPIHAPAQSPHLPRRLRARARARARTQRTRIHVAHSARTRLRHLPPSSVDPTTPLRRTRQPRPARQLAHTPLYSLTNLLVWTTTVCLWLMWVITYCMQMNPLIEPIPKVFGGSE